MPEMSGPARGRKNGGKGAHVKEIRVLFEDKNSVTHPSQGVGCRQAGGRASYDKEVEGDGCLVRFVWEW